MNNKVAIIGHGYVGQALENYFKDKFEVVIYDPIKGFDDKELVNACGLAVVSVPTTMLEDGSVDLSIVDEIFQWLQTESIVIKSTIPPGTTKKLAEQYNFADRLVFSPEYIGEGGYPVPHWEGVPHPTDVKLHQHIIFGGSREARDAVRPYFERVSGPFAHYHMTDSTTAELTKYMENTWIATKVTFCNEFYDIAGSYGVDYAELRELWLTDGRINPSHTLVYADQRGFDGKCIPKDTNGMVKNAAKQGYEAKFLAAVLDRNEDFRQL